MAGSLAPAVAQSGLDILPSDVLCDIASSLDYKSYVRCRGCSKAARAALPPESVAWRVRGALRCDWLQEAAAAGDVSVVRSLIAAGGVDCDELLKALLVASKRGHGAVVGVLHSAPLVTGEARGLALELAAWNGHRDVVAELAFAEGVEWVHRRRAFKVAAAKGRRDVMSELLPPPDANNEAGGAAAAARASQSGRQSAFILALMHGHADVVSELCVPGGTLEHYLLTAALNGHAGVVGVLMHAEGVTAQHRAAALAFAKQLGREEVVSVLTATAC